MSKSINIQGRMHIKKIVIGTLFVLLITIIAIGVSLWLLGIISFDKKTSSEMPRIEVSSSIGNNVKVGESGEIIAVLRDANKDIENSDFSYSCDKEDKISISGNKFTALSIDDDVVITVRCNDDAKIYTVLHIKISAANLSVKLNYPNEDGVYPAEPMMANIEWKEEDKRYVAILDKLNYGFEYKWVDEAGNEYDSASTFVVNYDTKLTAVFEPKKIEFEGFNGETYAPIEVLFGEEVDLTKYPVPQTKPNNDEDGWTFAGWFPDINEPDPDEEDSNRFIENGVKNGKFCFSGNTLFAKWTTQLTCKTIKFKNALSSERIEESIPVDVTYGASIVTLPTFEGDNSFKGWYTEEFGGSTDTECLNWENGDIYYGVANLILYDKREYKITIKSYKDAQETLREDVATYGKKLANDLPVPSLDQPNWNMEGWYIKVSSGVDEKESGVDEKELENVKIKGTELYRFDHDIEIYAKWSGEITFDAKIDSVYSKPCYVEYGSALELNEMPSNVGSWEFKGWYSSDDYFDEERIEEDFSQYTGNGRAILHAKWLNSEVNLNYYEGFDAEEEGFPSHLTNVIYGKCISENDLPKSGVPRQYYLMNGWYNGNSSQAINVSNSMTKFPEEMDVLYLRWKSQEFVITFNANGGTFGNNSSPNAVAYLDESMPLIDTNGNAIKQPMKANHTFVGYFTEEGDQYYGSGLNGGVGSSAVWNIAHNETLYAHWTLDYTVTYMNYDGSTLQQFNDRTVDSQVPAYTGRTPERASSAQYSYSFTGWKLQDESSVVNNRVQKKVEYVAQYNSTIRKYTVEWVNYNNSNIRTDSDVAYGTKLTPPSDPIYNDDTHDYTFKCWKNGDNKVDFSTFIVTGNITIKADYDITNKSTSGNGSGGGSCFAKGTEITLYDGSTVLVENLSVGDEILAFDHETGSFVNSRVLYVFKYSEFEVVDSIDLYFDNGTSVKFLNAGHGLFDVTLGEYVLIKGDNANDFVGHKFIVADYFNGSFTVKTVTLQSCDISWTREVERYDVVTEVTINHTVNGLLACSDAMVGISNVFDFTENYTYDMDAVLADINTYGLFEYDEWKDYLTYDEFIACNGQYVKIALGKGLITEDDIYSLIDYLKLCEEMNS